MIKKALFVCYKINNGKPLYFVYSRPGETDKLIPTGTCEKDEDSKNCAFREYKEELGQTHFRNYFPLGLSQVFENDNNQYREKAFAFEISDKLSTEKKEIDKFEFLDYDSARNKLTHKFHKESLKACNNKIHNNGFYKIFILIGPGGSGKDTLQKLVVNELDNVSIIKTIMTRKPYRDDDDITRVAVTEKELEGLEKNGEIIEKNKIAGNWYASSYTQLIKVLSKGKHGIINLDINGALKYKKMFSNVITVFITADLDEIEGRLRKRNTDEEEWIRERMKVARSEIKKAYLCDYVINNKDGKLDDSLKQLKNIIEREI